MITRDNYEEFFLLYVDNELPEDKRRLVERWVADNPDLEEEWQALLQCRLDPEADERVVFTNKEALLKRGEDHYEENLLLYIDGELDEKGRRAVEELARLDASKQQELERLRLTVSVADPAVVFPDKESLYRKPSGRRIVLAAWWRIAAAAIVLGAVGLLVLQPWHREGMRGGIVRTTDVPQGGEKKNDSPAVTPATARALHSTEAGIPDKPGARVVGVASGHEKKDGDRLLVKDAARGTKIVKGAPQEKEIVPQTGTALQEALRPAPREEETVAAVIGKPNGVQETRMEKVTHPADNAIGAVAFTEESIPKDKSSFATQELLARATTEASDNANSDIDTEPVSPKKNKLRGIFRKVTRTFEKTADRGEDGQRKILIGSFQFALK